MELNLSPGNVRKSHSDDFIAFSKRRAKMEEEWELIEPEESLTSLGKYDDWQDVVWHPEDDELGEWENG